MSPSFFLGTGERDGAARGGRRHLSRSLAGMDPRARAVPMGHDPRKYGQCARRSASGKVGRQNSKRPSPPIATALQKYNRARVPLDWALTQIESRLGLPCPIRQGPPAAPSRRCARSCRWGSRRISQGQGGFLHRQGQTPAQRNPPQRKVNCSGIVLSRPRSREGSLMPGRHQGR